MPLILYDFYFMPHDRERCIDRYFAYILTLYTNDIILAYSPIHYEDNSKFDFDTLPQIPQGYFIHVKLDSYDLKDMIGESISDR